MGFSGVGEDGSASVGMFGEMKKNTLGDKKNGKGCIFDKLVGQAVGENQNLRNAVFYNQV